VRYVVRTVLGMALFAFCWVLIGYDIYQLLQVGTCASGGPYVSARACPPGIERLMLSLVGGIFGLFLALAVYAGRGAPPGSDRKPQNGAMILWLWTGLFWSLAAGSFLGVWGPEANPGPGGKLGGLIVGFMGLLMGAGGLFALNLAGRMRDPQKLRPALASVVGTASRFAAAAGSVERLDTLDRLRRQGTLTEAEFETLKAKIVREA
jgi:hypothetical protein